MGLTVQVVNEQGASQSEMVCDAHNFLDRLLPHENESSYEMLCHIDRYGDTTFNGLQMGQFLREWKRIRDAAHTPEERSITEKIESLARQVRDEVHWYLKFIGD